ncbi:MAG: hypothetical protein AAF368_06970, partial [Planctomycetota bacterium]
MPASALAFLLATVASSAPLHAQAWVDEVIILQPELSTRLVETQNANNNEQVWNCMNVGLAEAMPSMRMIVPNDQSGDPDRIRHMLRLGKDLFVDGVTISGGTIQSDYDAGVLTGIEFRLWTANPVPQPAVTDTLGYRGAIYQDAGDSLVFLGWMYCFDAAGFTARLNAIAAFMGGTPLAQEQVWLGELMQATDTGTHSLRVQGTRNEVYGDLRSQGTVRLLGQENQVADRLLWSSALVSGGTNNTYGSDEQIALPMPSRTPRQSEGHYLSLAVAAGQSFVGDIVIEDDGNGGARVGSQSVSGVVHATGVIHVEGDDGIEAALTLIASAGVQFYGNNCVLTPAVDDLLVWAPGIVNPTASEHNHVRFEGRFN